MCSRKHFFRKVPTELKIVFFLLFKYISDYEINFEVLRWVNSIMYDCGSFIWNWPILNIYTNIGILHLYYVFSIKLT